MKTKTYILTFFIFFSGFSFGQEMILQNEKDSTFLEFKEKVYSLERLELDIEIEPTDTIQIIDENGMVEKYKLKYVEYKEEDIPKSHIPDFDINEYEQHRFKSSNENIQLFKPFRGNSYTKSKFGNDFIVVRKSEYSRRARIDSGLLISQYYYEIIRKEE